ncbi:hypothetical protein ACHRV5_08770 [Flavobacterium sp. FlaQc-52]|jgi:hypothetical protein|uniref:hypothetical protein n=1 Tax=Flavobacterium sp. FlaQc-52 TaxID=3374185 RepID=UPI0037578D0C
MKTIKTTLKASKVIVASAATKEKITETANTLKGKELFTDKIELAKKNLTDLKSLPI